MPSITTTLSTEKSTFLESYAKRIGKPKNYVLELGLELLEQKLLEDAVRQWFADRESTPEYPDEQWLRTQFASVRP